MIEPTGPARVRMLTKPGCHLCEAALDVLQAVSRETGEPFDLIDITLDPDLFDRYWEQIPVTFVDDRQVGAWTLDPQRLRVALAAADGRHDPREP